MKKLIIVSNRLPITINTSSGKLKVESSVGGLATGISSLKVKNKKKYILEICIKYFFKYVCFDFKNIHTTLITDFFAN